MQAEITKIGVKIGGVEHEMTMTQARDLHRALGDLLGEKTTIGPAPIVLVPHPYPVPVDPWPWRRWGTWCGSAGDSGGTVWLSDSSTTGAGAQSALTG